jgi:hypothetical protein
MKNIIILLFITGCSNYSGSEEKIKSCAKQKARTEGISYQKAYDKCKDQWYESTQIR